MLLDTERDVASAKMDMRRVHCITRERGVGAFYITVVHLWGFVLSNKCILNRVYCHTPASKESSSPTRLSSLGGYLPANKA